jgi:hypothetical protein
MKLATTLSIVLFCLLGSDLEIVVRCPSIDPRFHSCDWADFNGDGKVNIEDEAEFDKLYAPLSRFIDTFGDCFGGPNMARPCTCDWLDVDNDNDIDLQDVASLQNTTLRDIMMAGGKWQWKLER